MILGHAKKHGLPMPPLTIARNIEPGMEKPKFQPNLTGKALPSERKIGVFRRILDEALTADLPLPNPDDTVNSFLFALGEAPVAARIRC
ncbi:hypothetical protein EV356DRAFT_498595 [Viridothelium virens]|uniref:Uncharacterized protein n=1 Tax=Viridothelium virens TaxID=1048519 RepID=A0A6A6GS27_VIRVR|nr:hypothetical protein EV356DRAFT_498595 [Viridothelium virens]